MKTKYILLTAALAVFFASCEQQVPFDTQSPDDAPLILKPYNESGTGSFKYDLATPETPLLDSVTVTPSRYTTVNWYLDGCLVYTGTRIEMCFLAGKYALTIEAVTEAGKRTERTGSVTVHPFATDPTSSAPAAGRHFVPGVVSALDGDNLMQVSAVLLTSDVAGEKVLETITPSSVTSSRIEFMMPEMADGTYFVRLKDAEGKLYGADNIQVHNSAIVLDGFSTFAPNAEWTITGLKLQNVASVKLDDATITALTVSEDAITFTAPDVAMGEHTLSIQNQDGSAVPFLTADGLVTEVKAVATTEVTLWTGPEYLQWNENRVRIESADMAQVAAGSTILIYYEKLPSGHEGYYEGDTYNEYQKMKVMTAWWSDLFPEFDVNEATPNPYTFVYTAAMKELVDNQNALSIAGWGLQINKITYK